VHQDAAFYPHSNDDVLAVGLLLDDATADNGALAVLPGSHRGPMVGAEHVARRPAPPHQFLHRRRRHQPDA